MTGSAAEARRGGLPSGRGALGGRPRARGLSGLRRSGVLFAVIGSAALLVPFVVLSPNRIALGEGFALWRAVPPPAAAASLAALAAAFAAGCLAGSERVRLSASLLGLAALVGPLALASRVLTADAGEYARLSPGAGFWLLLLALLLLMADALSRMGLKPSERLGVLAALTAALGAVLASGLLDGLSVMQEYAARADSFWGEARRHVILALGSLALAAAVGFPLGVLCHRQEAVRSAVLPVLNLLQTIPSLAMFGVMIPALAWVGASVPGARALGIGGIGFAPAFLALFLYSLLPVVSNMVAGLGTVPGPVLEAARGMGMTAGQRLRRVELPLALPVVVAAIRIVLVQNIGLAVIAGLIGGGGFGVFVFQGLNQTATDLILLGALPTVLMATVAGVLLDSLVEAASTRARTPRP